MYHLLVSASGWESREFLSSDRIFEYTDDRLVNMFKPGGVLDQSKISQIPALFVSEIGLEGSQLARLGYVNGVETRGKEMRLDYYFDSEIPPIPNTVLLKMSGELDISSYEFSRTHWAIKKVDLFRVLLKTQPFAKITPKVFKLDEFGITDDRLVSVMMPFASEFDAVYETLQKVAQKMSLKCLRADDIWEHDVIIQDVVALINRARIVICDCTKRNPNVFYEAGIAHTLGKDVILIAQHESDIPFDLRHIRYVTYHNNNEGLENLAERVSQRIQKLLQ